MVKPVGTSYCRYSLESRGVADVLICVDGLHDLAFAFRPVVHALPGTNLFRICPSRTRCQVLQVANTVTYTIDRHHAPSFKA